jgi:peroxidase
MVQANNDLPSPNSDLDTLVAAFGKKNFTDRELVALSGAHTIGLAQCANVDKSQQQRCINANTNVLPLDEKTPEDFDNRYYGNLPNRGLLHSDRVLVDRADLRGLVVQYAFNKNLFFQDFANAMKKMSEMGVLTGANGEIRRNCSRVN